MTTPHNYESPSERAVPGAGGFYELEDESPESEEPETVVPEEEDDERARREEDRERREEDDAP